MAADIRALAADYINAVGEGRLDRLEELLHPDVEFGGTVGALRGAPALITAFRRLGAILVRNDIKRILVEGDKAFVLYDFVTDAEVGPVLSAESLTFEDGRIRDITLLFDWRRWPDVIQELTTRTAALMAANA